MLARPPHAGSLPRGRSAASPAPRLARALPLRAARPPRLQCSAQQPAGGGAAGAGDEHADRAASGAECGPSGSGAAPAGPQQQQRWQLPFGARGRQATGALGTAAVGSWMIAFPGLGGGGGGGGGGSSGGGGGGGGWWGNNSGGGGGGGGDGGGFGSNPAFDLAAAAAAGAAGAAGDAAGKKAKKKKGAAAEEEDPEAAAAEALLEEADVETEEAPGGGGGGRGGKGRSAAEELITSETELAEMVRDAGLEGDGQRHGTRRCVEVVIEGWPEVGALPKESELKDMLAVQEGFVFDYQDVVDDRRKLEL
jgi:hypothetical protein